MVSASFRVLFSVNRTYRLDSPPIMQGLFVPFACVGSSDPVRVLHLYTTNTLDTLWSIYCWDLCTTCCYQIYLLLVQALQLWDFLLLIRTLLKYLAKCALTLYCVVTYICACVDASRTVFWDRSYMIKGKAGEACHFGRWQHWTSLCCITVIRVFNCFLTIRVNYHYLLWTAHFLEWNIHKKNPSWDI